jgi:hypothetical protein
MRYCSRSIYMTAVVSGLVLIVGLLSRNPEVTPSNPVIPVAARGIHTPQIEMNGLDSPVRSRLSHKESNCGDTCPGHETAGTDTLEEKQTIDVAWIEPFKSAKMGDSVRLDPSGDRQWGGEVISITKHADNRMSMGVRLKDGGTLFAVFSSGKWSARISYRDRREAWLLEGDESGGTMRSIDITELLCSRGVGKSYVAGLPKNDLSNPIAEAAPVAQEATPVLNSLLGANGVVYLDFDGETVSGTNWNASYNGGDDIVAVTSGYSTTQIERVWKGIAEDYRPFNVNVTTDRSVYNATPTNRRIMIVFTTTYDWYSTVAVGGVAYLSSFSSSYFDDPAWVFTPNTGGAAGSAEAGAHEAGHTFGLRHDGSSAGSYYAGHGSGATSWAPIMGKSYNASVTQWSKGEYSGATNTEDDLALISGTSNGLGYRLDDHSNTTSGASPVTVTGGTTIGAIGVIEQTNDIDVFMVQSAAGSVSIQVENDPTDADLDIRLRLLDASGTQLAISESLSTLDASLSANVGGGTYFIEVVGVGTGDANTGYSDYASLGAYTISGTVSQPTVLAATITSPSAAAISLGFGSGLMLEGSATGGAFLWELTEAPAGGSVVFSSADALSTRCVFSAPGEYRLRLKVDSGTETDEDELVVSVEMPEDPRIYDNRGPRVDLGPDRGVYDSATVLSPLVSDDGVPAPSSLGYSWTILSGTGSLSSSTTMTPTLSFGSAGPVALRLVVTDGEIRTFDETILDGRFQNSVVLEPGAQGRVLVPVDQTVDSLWKAHGFVDTGWQSGQLGVGYDAGKNDKQRLFVPLIGNGLNVQTAMFGEQAGCYLRVPFELTNASAVLRLNLRMKYDDGFVAFINGVEVARSNVPNGVLSWSSLASEDRSDEMALSFENFPITLTPDLLRDGTNILAVHGVNSAIAGGSVKEARFVLVPQMESFLAILPFDNMVSVISDPGQRGMADNPDGDKWDNLQEHALGGNPELVDSLKVFELRSDRKPWLLLPESPPDDVRYEIERCNHLDGPWEVVSTKVGVGNWTGSVPVESTPAASNRVWLTFTPDTETKAFYRLRISLVIP